MTATDVVCGLCIFLWVSTVLVTWVWWLVRGNE